MYRAIVGTLTGLFIAACVLSAAAGFHYAYASTDEGAREILKKADLSRSPWSDFTMKSILNFKRRGTPVEETYRVYVKDHTKTLVGFLNPVKQRGNLLLMIGDNLWYYVKDTRRPIRITPIQKLSGGASYGDISRLSWSEDYDPVITGKEEIEIGEVSYPCIHLELTARSKGATYHRISLYVEEGTFFPRKADVYLRSGVHMKTLYYTVFKKLYGKFFNSEVVFVDHMSNDMITTLKYDEIEPRELPDRYFLRTQLSTLYGEVIK